MRRHNHRSLAGVACAALLVVLTVPTHTQYRFQPVGEHPDVAALGLVLRQLGTVGSLMMTTAHPDDENNALLARYKFQNGVRTTLVTATRGNGGYGMCPGGQTYPEYPAFNQGPPVGQVAYPYYTTRGPRDFLRNNPPTIGPY